MKFILPCFLWILAISTAFSQPVPPTNLTGTTFRSWLKTNWYDSYHNQLGYSTAREKMYAFIDNKSGVLYCVYSGFNQTNPYGNEITFPNPINCEHTVPQSFFSSNEPMRSDIHHLFPTHGDWNSERSNFAFDEIVDTDTEKWMRLASSQATIPTTLIEEYSESNVTSGDWSNPANRFEPREDHKGDVARAIFYFYTVYPTQGGVITDVGDLNTLCDWHQTDPPSAVEIQRNLDIETYQGNKNPYVSHPEIAENAWGCPAFNLAVELAFFQAEVKKDHVLLNWASLTEENNAWYEIERGTDQIGFQSLGKIQGAGTTSERSTYQFEDTNPSLGNNYYRLKMIDFEGRVTYSEMEHVRFTKDKNDFAINHYSWKGNQLQLNLQAPHAQEVIAELYDATGRMLMNSTQTFSIGQNIVNIQLSTVLPKGIYYFRLQNQNQNLFIGKIMR